MKRDSKPEKYTEEQLLEGEVRDRLRRLYALEARARDFRERGTPTTEVEHRDADLIAHVVIAMRIDLRKAERVLKACRERGRR